MASAGTLATVAERSHRASDERYGAQTIHGRSETGVWLPKRVLRAISASGTMKGAVWLQPYRRFYKAGPTKEAVELRRLIAAGCDPTITWL